MSEKPKLSGAEKMAQLEAWLDSNHEEIIEPELPIIDPHHHLWDRGGHTYLAPQFVKEAMSGHNIVTTIFAECFSMYRAHGPESYRCLGETEFVVGQSAMAASHTYGKQRICDGIIGTVDLALGAAAGPILDAQIIAGAGRFKGIRYATSYEPGVHSSYDTHPGMLLEAPVRAGFAELAKRNLTFDAWMCHTQLDDIAVIAGQFPTLAIIIDHVGGPVGNGPFEGKRDEVFAAWKKSMTALARFPNINVKLGGLGMRGAGFNFDRAAPPPTSATLAPLWQPYIDTCIEAFGVDRCMYESNFPVDKVSCGYATMWNALKRTASGATAAEKTALFHDTAARVYSLDLT